MNFANYTPFKSNKRKKSVMNLALPNSDSEIGMQPDSDPIKIKGSPQKGLLGLKRTVSQMQSPPTKLKSLIVKKSQISNSDPSMIFTSGSRQMHKRKSKTNHAFLKKRYIEEEEDKNDDNSSDNDDIFSSDMELEEFEETA